MNVIVTIISTETSNEWASHMRNCHTMVYCCQSLGHEAFVYERSIDLRRHLEISHAGEVEAEDIDDVLEAATLPSMDIWHLLIGFDPLDDDCEVPLCRLCGQPVADLITLSDSAQRTELLLNHIGSHLEDIALQCLRAQLLDNKEPSAGSDEALDEQASTRAEEDLPSVAMLNSSLDADRIGSEDGNEAGSVIERSDAQEIENIPESVVDLNLMTPSQSQDLLEHSVGHVAQTLVRPAAPATSGFKRVSKAGVTWLDRQSAENNARLSSGVHTPDLLVAIDFGMTCEYFPPILD